MKDFATQETMEALREMFPGLEEAIVLAVVESSDSTEAAIAALLDICGGDPMAQVDETFLVQAQSNPGTQPAATSPTAQGGAKKQQAKQQPKQPHPKPLSWGQLRGVPPPQLPSPTATHHHYHQPPVTASQPPRYVAPTGQQHVRLVAQEFPDLAPQAPSPDPHRRAASSSERRAGEEANRYSMQRDQHQEAQPLPRRSGSYGSIEGMKKGPSGCGQRKQRSSSGNDSQRCGSAKAVARGSASGGNARGYAEAARTATWQEYVQQQQQQVQQQEVRPVGVWPELADGDGPGGGAGGGQEAWQRAAVEELCRSHPWAVRDLVEAVCEALQYDLEEVVSALDELQAASHQREDGGGARRGASPGASDARLALGAANGCGGDSSGSSGDDSSDAYSSSDGGDGGSGRLDKRPGGPNSCRRRHAQVQARSSQAAQAGNAPQGGIGRGGRRNRSGSGMGNAAGDDVYYKHRSSALKLTHAWRKKMDRASAAFSSGDRALGRRLVAEAQALRAQAAGAHQAAAAQIEEENNRGRQLSEWELDLHGLHATEAVEALARRLQSLQASVNATAALANGSNKLAAQASTWNAAAGGGAAAAGPAAASGPLDGAALLAKRRVLRVIVGKGLHSSGGEASLPRVVEGFLLSNGYKYTPRAGQVEVQLRRNYALQVTGQQPV